MNNIFTITNIFLNFTPFIITEIESESLKFHIFSEIVKSWIWVFSSLCHFYDRYQLMSAACTYVA